MAGGSFFSRLKDGLSKTRELLLMNVTAIARGIGPVDETVLADLEEALVLADAGAALAGEYVQALREKWRRGELPDTEALRAELKRMVAATRPGGRGGNEVGSFAFIPLPLSSRPSGKLPA